MDTTDQKYLHIVSPNIRGVYSNLANAVRTRADIICLQETDILDSEVNDFCAQAGIDGYRVHFSSIVPLTRDGVGAHGRRAAIVIHNNIKPADVADSEDNNIQSLFKTGRYVKRLIPFW